MLKKMSGVILSMAVALSGFCAGVLIPVPGGPDLQKLEWKASDEFCRKEHRDGRTFLVIDVPRGREAGIHAFLAKIDVKSFRNKSVSVMIRYRVDNVGNPPKLYLGSKLMLGYTVGGGKRWPDANLPEGSSDGWMTGTLVEGFRSNADNGELMLGLQDVSGRIEFDLSTLEIGEAFSPENRINLDYIVSYPEAVERHCRQRGVMAPGRRMSEDDLKTLHRWGANLVRAQITRNWGAINTELDLAEYKQWLDAKLDDLEKTMELARKYGIKFVIDLHSPPGGKIDARNMRMFFERKYADAFIDCWKKIATRFKDNPQIYAYDLVNEPVQAIPSECDYWELQRRAAEAVRAIDPDTPIMIESNESDRPQTYVYLSPIRMDNVIYKVHMYFPLAYTHQRLRGEKDPVFGYPGMIEGEMWNRDKIKETLQPVRDFQLRHKCKIYVGEFSAVVWAPGADQYIRDCISVFEEYGWDWTFHAFREWSGWSVEHDGTNPDDLKPAADTARKRALVDGLKLNMKE